MLGIGLLALAVAAAPPVDTPADRLATVEALGAQLDPNWNKPPVIPLFEEPWYLRIPFLGQGNSCSTFGRSTRCSVNIHTRYGTVTGRANVVVPRQ